MGKQPLESLKLMFEAAFVEYHHHRESRLDPVSLVWAYPDPKDQEIVAFLVALLSYGNVTTILQSGKRALEPLSPSPYVYLTSHKTLNLWPQFKHRFTTGVDIEILAHWLRSILKNHGSLENFFVSVSTQPLSPMREKISAFTRGFWSQPLPPLLEKSLIQRSRNMKYLLSDPEAGSACKRLNMFLRWVVRPKDGVDLGLWTKISASELMLPIDTHLLQTLKKLRWTRSEDANWKTVEKATQKLREISKEDPIRYDFALCHLSMAGEDIRKYQTIISSKDSAHA